MGRSLSNRYLSIACPPTGRDKKEVILCDLCGPVVNKKRRKSMGEIKSSLELAMERTKKIAISGKEREEIKRREIDQKVNALSNRYREGHLPLNEILREMGRMDEKTSTLVKETLLSGWINALSLKDEDERLIKGIETLKHRNADELKEKHHQLLSQYRGEKEKAEEKIRAQIAEALKRERIYGSAVQPNIEASRLWQKELGNLDQLFGPQLEELKEKLRTL